MSIPTHGPYCRTKTFPVDCRYCSSTIFLLQCTCGSAVLLEELGWPWPRHDCGGAGGEKLPRGWDAIRKLKDMGINIDAQVMEFAFGPSRRGTRQPPPPTLTKVDPIGGEKIQLMAILRDYVPTSKLLRELDELGPVGRKLLNVTVIDSCQVTLHDVTGSPPKSYRCVVPKTSANPSKLEGVMVSVMLRGFRSGSLQAWVAESLKPI